MSFNSIRDGLIRVKKKYDNWNQQNNYFPSSQNYQYGQSQPQQYYQGPPGQQQQQWQQVQQPQQPPYYQQQQQPPYMYNQQPQQQQPPPWVQNNQWQQQPQQNYGLPPPAPEWNRPPPPIPQNSHPSQQQGHQQPHNQIYWQARFDPATPVSQEWDQKLGNNNGWGNNELEHYTANAENAFYTGDNKLIVRAISNNSSSTPEGKYTSARLVSRQTLARSRGVLTAFLVSPCAQGIWPAFWLLPREPFQWPNEGEVDIAETWNGDHNNKSCLHWGMYNAEDANKHRTMATQIDDMSRRAVRYDFAWDQQSGRLMWYIDGRSIMKATIPGGTRPMEDWCILLNVAMGGNVCGGQLPKDGAYDLVVHALYMSEELEFGGWQRFEVDWQRCPDGKTN